MTDSAAPRITVVIPALDEEDAIGLVLRELPPLVNEVVVVDNGSRDRTAAVARAGGARVVSAPTRGYGEACLAGVAAAEGADILVFLDGDHSDHPGQVDRVVRPIRRLEMRDRGFGWTVEMQLRARRLGLRVREVPVDYRPRIGRSKVSGTVSGSLRAGLTILGMIARHASSRRSRRMAAP